MKTGLSQSFPCNFNLVVGQNFVLIMSIFCFVLYYSKLAMDEVSLDEMLSDEEADYLQSMDME